MRVNSAEIEVFDWLIKVGEGRNILCDGLHVEIPKRLIANSDIIILLILLIY